MTVPALSSLIVAIAALGTMLITLRATVLNGRSIGKARKDIRDDVQRVEVRVDGQLSDLLNRVEQLTRSLKNSGIDVPDDPADPTSHTPR